MNETGEKYIEIIDYEYIGTLLSNMVLNNGIHQFLQIKHELGLSSESLVSSYVSNVKYFKCYSKLTGLTGTMGSAKEVQTLKHIYNIEIWRVPTFKFKRLIEYPSQLLRLTMNPG